MVAITGGVGDDGMLEARDALRCPVVQGTVLMTKESLEVPSVEATKLSCGAMVGAWTREAAGSPRGPAGIAAVFSASQVLLLGSLREPRPCSVCRVSCVTAL